MKIYGQVQGVFYRAFAKQTADELGIAGYVKNEQDGAVYIEAEGEEKILNKFVQLCWHGPRPAQVTNVKVTSSDFKNYSDFLIVH